MGNWYVKKGEIWNTYGKCITGKAETILLSFVRRDTSSTFDPKARFFVDILRSGKSIPSLCLEAFFPFGEYFFFLFSSEIKGVYVELSFVHKDTSSTTHKCFQKLILPQTFNVWAIPVQKHSTLLVKVFFSYMKLKGVYMRSKRLFI